jgi:predicted DNA-binding transcriptional regulator AlpA
MIDLLTTDEVAALLRVSKRHIYELTQDRTRSGDLRENPLPCIRLGASVRFRKSDVEAWIERLATRGR